jgi:hypothetical protein
VITLALSKGRILEETLPLLQAAGIEESAADPVPEVNEKGERLGWVERWRLYSDKQRKGRTLGVWVVYFSLAALPIFGLGQALIPAGETVDLLVDMANPGTWLLHCHVAEHMGAGMMSAFVVK